MKRSTLFTIMAIGLVFLCSARDSRAQSNSLSNVVRTKQDPVVQELLGEVRQLRIALQHITVNAYRGQVLIERLRLQQEQVNRLSQELGSTRNQLGEMRTEQASAKAKLDESEKGQEKGLVSEATTAKHREVLEGLLRHELRLSEREVQVVAALEAERVNLADLNKRLDALELEIMATSQVDETKKPPKR
jgi:hypothetical protein